MSRISIASKSWSFVKYIVYWSLPQGIVAIYGKLILSRREREFEPHGMELQDMKQHIDEEYAKCRASDITRNECVMLLGEWGLDTTQIDEGSIPERDLNEICNTIQGLQQPVCGIHVGNFVGVSLAYVATRLKKMNKRSTIISIDPDLPHRGIFNTEQKVTKLLRVLDIQDVVIRITGYTMEKSRSNDGFTFAGYDPTQHFLEEDAPEYQLRNLLKILEGKVDFVMIDGNHDPNYLEAEVRVCHQLLPAGGVVFLDDIDIHWPALRDRFERLAKEQIFSATHIGTRTGVLVKL